MEDLNSVKRYLEALGVTHLDDVKWDDALMCWMLRGDYRNFHIVSTARIRDCSSTEEVKLRLFCGFVDKIRKAHPGCYKTGRGSFENLT